MATLGRLMVTVGADISDMERGLQSARDKISGFGASMTQIGGRLTAGLTLPILGVAAAAIEAGTKMNAAMANIASLGIAEERVLAMKSQVQDLAIEMGKSTEDMSGGLYEVISAFGDTGNSMEILQISAKAGAAGLATTKDAIGLVAAVTKGYGDTSTEAAQKTADLAFMTVNLGQTTFPELAASMGKVIPIAAALGASEEEVWAQMATLTGVTGNTAEVTTQLRAAYQALLNPTTEMQGAIAGVANELDAQGKLAGGPLVDQWRAARDEGVEFGLALNLMRDMLKDLERATKPSAKAIKEMKSSIKEQETLTTDAAIATKKLAAALGPTLVESIGLTGTLNSLGKQAGGNTASLAKMYGSVEALSAVLALSGGQADSYVEKLAAMQNVTGTTDRAFEAQTQGLNKLGFTWAQLQVRVQVALEKISEGLAPALNALVVVAQPMIDRVLEMADAFALMDEPTQTWIVGMVAAAAAIGPVLMILGTLISAFAFLLSPIGLVIAAIAGLAAAWYTNFGGIQEKTAAVWSTIKPYLFALYDYILSKIPGALTYLSNLWATTWVTIQQVTVTILAGITPVMLLLYGWLQSVLPDSLQGWSIAWSTGWGTIKSALVISWNYIRSVFASFQAWLLNNLPTAILKFSTSWSLDWETIKTTFLTAWQAIEVKLLSIYVWLQTTLSGVINEFAKLWATHWPTIQNAVLTAWGAIGPALQKMWAWILLNKEEIERIVKAVAGFFIFRQAAGIVYTLILPIALLAGALATILQLFINLAAVGKILITVMTAILSPVGLLVVGILALAGAFGYLFYYDIGGFRTKTVAAFEALKEAAQKAWDILAPYILPVLNRIREAAGTLGERMAPLATSFARLGEALKPVAFGLAIIGGIITGVIAGVALVALNLLASALEQLPVIVGVAVDNLTATIETINAVVLTMINAVKLAIAGDWAGAWQEAKRIVAIYWLYFNRTINSLTTIVVSVFNLIKSTVVAILTQLGIDTTAFMTTFKEGWDKAWLAIAGAISAVRNAAINLVTYLSGKFTEAWEALKKMLTFDFPNPFKSIQNAIESMADKIRPLLDMLDKLKNWSGGTDTPVNPALTQRSGTRKQPLISGGLVAAGMGGGVFNLTLNVNVGDPKDKNEWRKVARMVADEFERVRR